MTKSECNRTFNHSFRDHKYKFNQSIVSILGYGENKKIRVVTMRALRTAGIEDPEDVHKAPPGSVNDEKLDCNIQRAKREIYELAYCNPWDWFVTITLDPEKYDRTDLEKYHQDLTRWLRNQRTKWDCKLAFLLIPELHLDGKSWHMHGFIKGLPKDALERFEVGMRMGKALAEKVKNGDEVYNWPDYQKKFGFCDLEPIKNQEAVSKYVTKYITKELAGSVKKVGAHMYYHSRGLYHAETIKKGTMVAPIVPDYVGEYASVATIDYSREKLDEILSGFLTDSVPTEYQEVNELSQPRLISSDVWVPFE